MIRLESLVYLQEVAKTKSINKAAEGLYISKSALSTALKNLEREFGMPLLERSVHGVTLTEAGENVVERSNLIFGIIDALKSDMRRYGDTGKVINIYTEAAFASSIFPSILVGLKKMLPNTYFSSYSVALEFLLQKVGEEKNNIGFLLDHQAALPYDGISDEVLWREIAAFELEVVCSKYSKFIPANIDKLSMEDLKSIPQICLNVGGESYDIGEKVQTHAYSVGQNYVLSTDNNTTYYQAILNDLGVGFMLKMPVLFGTSERKQLRFIPIENSEKMTLWFIHHKNLEDFYADEIWRCVKSIINNY